MIHILAHETYQPYFTTLALLKATLEVHGSDFAWREPPYEYEYEKMPIDMILGDSDLRREIETGGDLMVIKERWSKESEEFLRFRSPYLLYS
jgi:uncharacterized protein YbbC (DUF1343 family)